MEAEAIATIISGGGTVALAVVVYFQLRDHGAQLKASTDVQRDTAGILGGILALMKKGGDNE